MAKKQTKTGKIAPKADAADQLKDFMVDGLKIYIGLKKHL